MNICINRPTDKKAGAVFLLFIMLVLLLIPFKGITQSPTPGSFAMSYPSGIQALTVGTSIVPIVPITTNAPAFDKQLTSTFAGPATGGALNFPTHTATSGAGFIYVTDSYNNRIKRISPNSLTSILAGSGSAGAANGTGTSASFNRPVAMALDAGGSNIYVCDQLNHSIRKVTTSGVVTTIAGTGIPGFVDGTSAVAQFNYPSGVAIDQSGNLYVSDRDNNRIRKISTSGLVSTFAGSGQAGSTNGAASSASFNSPRHLAFDPFGNLYVADCGNHLIRKISSSGDVSTLAGTGIAGYIDGPGTLAQFNFPSGLTFDASGNLFVADMGNNIIRKITSDGQVSSFAGATTSGLVNGTGSVVRFNGPSGICVDNTGALFVADQNNQSIRKIVTRPFSIDRPLPQGLTFDYTTGTISGTPMVSLTSNIYSITAYGVTATVTLAINSNNPLGISVNENYITEYSLRKEGYTTLEGVISASINPSEVQTLVQYFDGLGRPLQTVHVKGSADAIKDIVTPHQYDGYGREAKKFLAYASSNSNDGRYKISALTDVISYYSGASPASGLASSFLTPYSQTVFEPSPLNRILEQGAPGDSWQPIANSSAGHTVKSEYTSNISSEVKCYDAEVCQTIGEELKRTLKLSAANSGYYATNELYKTITKDENWKVSQTFVQAGTTEEYKDKEGRVVLKRVFNEKAGALETLSTYYVYDDFGNLSFVLPPGSNPDGGIPTEGALNNYCYQYRYDHRNRLVEKKLPGKEWEYIIYNTLDQVILSQDGNQRSKAPQEWLVNKYDALGRMVATGIYTYGSQANTNYRQNLQEDLTTAKDEQNVLLPLWEETRSGGNGYTSSADKYRSYPQTLQKTLSLNYYGSYSFPGNPYSPTATGVVEEARTKGLLTGSKMLNLKSESTLLTVNYYDKEGRVRQSFAQNHVGGVDEVVNDYNFSGELEKSVRKHSTTATPSLEIVNQYQYDHMGRKTQTKQKIGSGAEVVLSKLEYNELGQLVRKKLHGVEGRSAIQATETLDGDDVAVRGNMPVMASSSITLLPGFTATYGFSARIGGDFAQEIQYVYNERGWLKQINDPNNISTDKVFGLKLWYEDHADNSKKQYNGNISGASWQTKVPSGLNLSQKLQSYDYSYDKLNRLTLADYTTPNEAGKYNESLEYDLMGNITRLQRTAGATGTLVNNLTYTYSKNGESGNKLWSITDAGSSPKASTYDYDLNGNLVSDSRKQITNIVYNHLNLPSVVTQNGNSVSFAYDATGQKLSKLSAGVTRNYIAGIEYENNVLTQIQTEEGRAVPTPGGTYVFEYFLKDHLGNTRAVVREDGSIVQVQDYYAFGLEMNAGNQFVSSTSGTPNQYKYNGKEKQEELEVYDYGARFYDPMTGRFNTIDPHAENYLSHSTYAYVGNNPILRIDPDGKDWFVNNNTGEVIYLKGQSKVTQAFLDDKGIAQSSKSYERLGADNMFGNKLAYGGDKNMLSHDFVYVDNPRAFMKDQGYEMAERVNIKETEFVSGGAIGSEENITHTVTDLKQLGDSKITYTTPDHLNEKTNERTVLNDQGKWNSIETTTYTLTKPYGQSNEQTAKYGSKGTTEKSVGALGVVVDWITRYFENKK